ncbi:MAG: sugar ABC transporter ATP-binding protein [Planctomycetota bacterium]|jgi:ribose transport system ATP-binding protein
MNAAETFSVEMEGITKSFGGVHALRDVDFRVEAGQVHALVGENGAGKSTLMKILSGAYQKDTGQIKIDGEVVNIPNPHAGRKRGIAIIYQEFALAPDLTVAENIYLDHLSSRRGFINWKALYRNAGDLISSLGFDINPRSKVEDLSVAYQQVVEITKALSEDAKILILDEPTAVLAPREVERLFEVLRRLKEQGVSIIYISHRLEEVFQIADKITVLRDGAVSGAVQREKATTDEVINLMIGRKLTTMFPKRECEIGEEVFKVEGLNRGRQVRDVTFEVREGEVVGIAGLVGSGRTETVRAIFGADKKDSGKIWLKGKPLKITSPKRAVQSGIGLVPEDRKGQGTILSMSIRENITMPSIWKIMGKVGIIKRRKEKGITEGLIQKLAIKSRGTESKVADLSGGNQQKVVLAKWFGTECEVIILDEPTRGVDVGAKVEIYNLINELASNGLGIIVISSEMIEVIGICDRVIVMREGKIGAVLKKGELTEENIMRPAIGQN